MFSIFDGAIVDEEVANKSVKGIVEAHEGEVWVESGEGEGSTFWFSLPPGPEGAP